MLVNQLNS